MMKTKVMKAMRLHGYKKPLQLDDVPIPKVAGGGVLVKVKACGVCRYEIHAASGNPPFPIRLPFIFGHEVAGIVEDVGEDAVGVKRGEPVAVYPLWSCGTCRFCRGGLEGLACQNVVAAGMFGADGGYAEYIYVPSYRNLVKIGSLDPVEAAPIQCAGITAYNATKKVIHKLHPESCVVLVGIGGCGHLGVQYLKVLSPAKVIAIDIAEDKLRLAEQLGADYVVNSSTSNPIDEVKKISGGAGATAVIDYVGLDSTLRNDIGMLGMTGRLVLVGVGGVLHLPVVTIVNNQYEVIGTAMGSYNDLREALALSKAGKVRSIIKSYKLEEANEASEALRRGEILGRAVLTP